jgi:hypothetical protein
LDPKGRFKQKQLDIAQYWLKLAQEKVGSPVAGSLGFMQLFHWMTAREINQRATLEDIKKHPWLLNGDKEFQEDKKLGEFFSVRTSI